MNNMRYFKTILFFLMATILSQPLVAQTTSKPVYVIVHGAWGGGWAFKKVDSLLTETGSTVYRPTLTGQGERVHLASPNVGLDTHIMDVVNTILYEDLTNVILVGHSYGGMVVTGVADSIPDRIFKLIYIDAIVPEDNESAFSIFEERYHRFKVVNGGIIPPWVSEGTSPPKDVPHPLKTWEDSISLKNPARLEISTSYILTVAKGAEPVLDDFASQAERAQQKGWSMFQLEADHNAQWSAPEEFVKMLKNIENN
ncbi:MAG: alpha/beta hydrolase [Flavobacteriaceae bacterium]|nr:MAG: alpha/beta hydrolase [Flavobacteriaceae bacterium]